MTTTMELAARVAGTDGASIPPEAIAEAKQPAQLTGVAIGAARHPLVDRLLDLSAELGGKEQATVLGRAAARTS